MKILILLSIIALTDSFAARYNRFQRSTVKMSNTHYNKLVSKVIATLLTTTILIGIYINNIMQYITITSTYICVNTIPVQYIIILLGPSPERALAGDVFSNQGPAAGSLNPYLFYFNDIFFFY